VTGKENKWPRKPLWANLLCMWDSLHHFRLKCFNEVSILNIYTHYIWYYLVGQIENALLWCSRFRKRRSGIIFCFNTMSACLCYFGKILSVNHTYRNLAWNKSNLYKRVFFKPNFAETVIMMLHHYKRTGFRARYSIPSALICPTGLRCGYRDWKHQISVMKFSEKCFPQPSVFT